MKSYLSVDAGGTFLKSAILNSKGEVFQESACSVESFSDGPKEKILQAFGDIISKGLNFIRDNGMELGGIGVAFPGPFDIEKATPLMHHKFQAIYGINLRALFYQNSGVPEKIPIKFIHDANAVLAGELWKGNAQGFDNAAVVTLGTGLGFAVSERRKVLCNTLGGPFLSIFQLPYKEGILEDYASKRGFMKIYQELNNQANCNEIDVSDLGEWADNGDQASILTFRKIGEILGESLRDILTERKIECLLFGGQISRSFPFMEEPLKEALKDVGSLKRVTMVKSIDYAAFLGAISTILQK